MTKHLFKRGRRPALHDRRTMRSALVLHKHLASLGTPPTTSDDYVSAVLAQLNSSNQPDGGLWGMFGNGPPGFPDAPGGVGDCTCADSGHEVMVHSANGGTIVVPTNAEVEQMYETVGGYVPGNPSTDQGADETTVCRYMESTGLAGVKSDATGMVDPSNLDLIKWCVQIFGSCRLGIIVDEQMEDEFSSGQPWETAAASDDSTAGGHDVPIVKYDEDYAYIVTWGGGSWLQGLQPVAWSLIANSNFLEEAHCECYGDFVRSGGTAPNGLDLDQLLVDLKEMV